jgi:hypothetical protein
MTNWLKLGEKIKLTNRMYAKNRDIHSESRLEKWTNCPKKKRVECVVMVLQWVVEEGKSCAGLEEAIE